MISLNVFFGFVNLLDVKKIIAKGPTGLTIVMSNVEITPNRRKLRRGYDES